jgi:hypothetical protein
MQQLRRLKPVDWGIVLRPQFRLAMAKQRRGFLSLAVLRSIPQSQLTLAAFG